MAEAAKKQEPQPEPGKAPPAKERWMQWVALTTTVLAVCAAISALKGGGYSTRVQLSTTQEVNKWSYFQSKSIKQHAVELHRDQLELIRLEAHSSEAQRLIEQSVAKANAELARYEQEKAQIKAEAEVIQKDEGELKRHAGAFGLAVMLLQIAIMLSSVGALLKKPATWVVGLGFGPLGLVSLGNGSLLFF